MNSAFNLGDWLIIVVYLGGIVGLGIWFGRDQRTTRDYFLGSRNIPWWGIGLSIVAAETSALTIIGVPAIAYGSNLMFIQMIGGYVIARIVLAAVMVPHYLAGEIYSPYQLLEQHLGHGPRRLAAAMFLFLETLAAGVRVYVACIPIRLMLGENICSLGGLLNPILGAILLFVGLSLLYTYIGGVKAVIWTDAAQFGLFLGGGIFALFFIPTLVDGGWSAAWATASAAGKLAWFNPTFTFGAPFNIWMGLLGGTALVLSSHGAEQLIVQRVLSCRNVAEGRKALVLSAVVIFPLMLIFLLVGAMLWVFYQAHPFRMALPETRPGIKSSDFIFPVFLITEVPHLLKGFLIVAILAAAMSSISSAITSLASVSTMDFLKPLSPHRSEEFFLRFSKASTIFWAVVLILIAWMSRQVEFVLNAAFSLRGLTSGALLGSLIIALFCRRWGARATMTGMICSVIVMNVLYWPPNTPALRDWWMRTVGLDVFWPWYTLIGTLITLGVACGMARFSPTATQVRTLLVIGRAALGSLSSERIGNAGKHRAGFVVTSLTPASRPTMPPPPPMHDSDNRLAAEPPLSPSLPPDDFNHAAWFSAEVLPHEPALRAWLRSHFPSLSENDDVVQESYVRLWRARDHSKVTNAKSYLFTVARNITFDLFRRARSAPVVPASEPETLAVIEDRIGVAEAVCNSQEFGILRQAIDALPERCRAIVTLQKLHGLSNHEIAKKLGLSVNTVNAQLVIGLARCRRFLLARGVLRGRHQ